MFRRNSDVDEPYRYEGPRARWVENWLRKCHEPGMKNINYKIFSFIPVLGGAVHHTAFQYIGGCRLFSDSIDGSDTGSRGSEPKLR